MCHPDACGTATEAFHESFWLATGAAVPVIALAAMVAMADLARHVTLTSRDVDTTTKQRHGRPDSSDPVISLARGARSKSVMALVLTLINLIAQAALLAFSLYALAYSRDVMPPPVAISLAVGGVVALVESAWYAIDARSLRRRHCERRDSGATDAGAETKKMD
jgi:uncharacterized membrane protein YbhN (UPF0104 family)